MRQYRYYYTVAACIVAACFFLLSASGCEGFARKFRRKPKKQSFPAEERLIVPEEYEIPQASDEDLYRQAFLYWRSWHNELIASLLPQGNLKRQRACADEAIENLRQMYTLLNTEARENLTPRIEALEDLRERISADPYGDKSARHRRDAEIIQKHIARNFSFHKIKGSLRQ